MVKTPAGGRKRLLQVELPAHPATTPEEPAPPALRRLSTPDCMSSPVSHLRALTHDLDEGAKRRRAAQYLRETREAHLRQRRLYLVLDLDETLVHSMRSSIRQVGTSTAVEQSHTQGEETRPATAGRSGHSTDRPGDDRDDEQPEGNSERSPRDGGHGEGRDECSREGGASGEREGVAQAEEEGVDAERKSFDEEEEEEEEEEEGEGEEEEEEEEEGDDDDDDDNDADVSMRNGGSGSNSGPHIGHLASSPLGGTAPPVWAKSTGGEAGLPEGFVTLRVQNVEFEMMLRPVCLGVMHTVAAVRVGRALPSCHCT